MSLSNCFQSKNIIFLMFSLTLIISANANAANWVEIAGNDAVVVSVDTDSLRRTGAKVKSWLQWQWSRPIDVPNTYPVKYYKLEKQLQVSDCKVNTLAIAQGVRYADLSGSEIVDSYTIEEKFWKFSEPAPETIGESIIKYVCNVTSSKRK